ncbi:MAG: Kazal-type serine protease inhibitor domain-containing protein [Myxococcota bacterium]|nr:Kazal-type serine protease inhibitor domain-containing protein [Myxococcota bacterium]
MRFARPFQLFMLLLFLLSGQTLLGCSSGEADVPFQPPLLLERDSSTVIGSVDGPHPLPLLKSSTFSGPFDAYSVELLDSSLRIQITTAKNNVELSLAVYGPRSSTGIWGKAIVSHSGPAPLSLELSALNPGRYLLLFAGSEEAQYELSVDCAGPCTPTVPVCEGHGECPLVCPNGYEVDDFGCELCSCARVCFSDFDCPPDTLCSVDGECVSSCQCSDLFEPVCGSNGETFANACEARCANVEIVSYSPCPTDCPALNCENSCSFGYAVGPDACPTCACNSACDLCGAEVNPVCSANGITYVNRCLAECTGELVAYTGSCRSQCAALHCAQSCEAGFVLDEGGCPTCDCAPLVECKELSAVCGSHGGSYSSPCAAQRDGVEVVYSGACPNIFCADQAACPLGTQCVKPPEGEPCVLAADGESCLGLCYREQSCGSEADLPCPFGYTCITGRCESRCQCSALFNPVCGVNGELYDNACSAACQGVAVSKVGYCCPAFSCELDCPFGYAQDINGCEICACRTEPACACTEADNPVCVLHDDVMVTYRNACWAQCDGFTPIAEGSCP